MQDAASSQNVKHYFDRHRYAESASPSQRRVLDTLRAVFNAIEFSSLLEVGPGQGFALGLLDGSTHVAITDVTLNTLLPLPYPAFQASLGSLPLADDSFDVVLATDVIEHIPPEQIDDAVADAFRVASRYVVLGVPLAEDIIDKATRCGSCGEVFHINHHYRRYLPDDLLAYCPEGWDASAVFYTGIRRPTKYPSASMRRRVAGESKAYDRTNCPRCGFAGPFGGEEVDQARLDALEFEMVLGEDAAREALRIPSSEAVVLFAREGEARLPIEATPLARLLARATKVPVSRIDGVSGDAFLDRHVRKFKTIPHLQARPDTVLRSSGEGIEFRFPEGEPCRLTACFPPRCDAVGVRVLGIAPGECTVRVRDQALGRDLGERTVSGRFEASFRAEKPENDAADRSLGIDPARGYRLQLVLDATGSDSTIQILSVELLEKDPDPGAIECCTIAHLDPAELIEVPCESCEVYYQSPELDGGFRVIPESLWTSPLMRYDRVDAAGMFASLRDAATRRCASSSSVETRKPSGLRGLLASMVGTMRGVQPVKPRDRATGTGEPGASISEELSMLPDAARIDRPMPDWLVDLFRCPRSGEPLVVERADGITTLRSQQGRYTVHKGVGLMLGPASVRARAGDP